MRFAVLLAVFAASCSAPTGPCVEKCVEHRMILREDFKVTPVCGADKWFAAEACTACAEVFREQGAGPVDLCNDKGRFTEPNTVPPLSTCGDLTCPNSVVLTFVDDAADPIAIASGEWSYPGRMGEFKCPAGGEQIQCIPGNASLLLKFGRRDSLLAPTKIELTVRTSTPALTWSGTLAPEYSINRPNGEKCPPTCANARMEVVVR